MLRVKEKISGLPTPAEWPKGLTNTPGLHETFPGDASPQQLLSFSLNLYYTSILFITLAANFLFTLYIPLLLLLCQFPYVKWGMQNFSQHMREGFHFTVSSKCLYYYNHSGLNTFGLNTRNPLWTQTLTHNIVFIKI